MLTEDETIDRALAGASLARFGDGELRLCHGADCASQRRDKRLAAELKNILAGDDGGALVCLPHDRAGPKARNWARYAEPRYTKMIAPGEYGSAFVTRPDSAPWIDRPDYWEKIRGLWAGRRVGLVTGEPLTSGKMRRVPEGAAGVTLVGAPRQHAYAEIDDIERRAAATGLDLFVLCLGPTATCLAVRLARRGAQALDMGHVGMFMGREGR